MFPDQILSVRRSVEGVIVVINLVNPSIFRWMTLFLNLNARGVGSSLGLVARVPSLSKVIKKQDSQKIEALTLKRGIIGF